MWSDNPREWDNLGTMACWHKRYNLGDEQGDSDPCEHLTMLEKTRAVFLPLYLYDHSGLVISTEDFYGRVPQGHAELDSGQVGWISVDLGKLRHEFGWQRVTKDRRAEVLEYLEDEVNLYSDYLRG